MTTTPPQGYVDEIVEVTGYPSAQGIYLKRGWPSALPLPPRAKKSPPPGFHGRGGAWPSPEKLAEWVRASPSDANLCLRLNGEPFGIDVDACERKTGAETLDEAECRWCELPPTVMSGSCDDGVSGIRLFRVLAGSEPSLQDEGGFEVRD